MEYRKGFDTNKGYKMDLTKGLKFDYLRTGEAHDVQIIEFWYNQARIATDINKKDEYANRAIYKSKLVAWQENWKVTQKERKSKTIFQDAVADFSIMDKGSMGISITSNTDFTSHSWYSDEDVGPNSVTASFTPFLPESYLEDHVIQLDLFDVLVKSCGEDDDEMYHGRKLIVATFIFNSKYDRFITLPQYQFFEKEFEFLTHIAKCDIVYYTDLFEHRELSKRIFGRLNTKIQLEACKSEVIYFMKLALKKRA